MFFTLSIEAGSLNGTQNWRISESSKAAYFWDFVLLEYWAAGASSLGLSVGAGT